MSNELATLNDVQFPMAKHTEDEKSWGAVVTAASYLPYVSLYGGNSNVVKEGKIGIAHYGLCRSKDKIEDLGKEFDLLALSWRFKAMEITKDGGIITKYDPKSSAFTSIQERSAIKDSGCMYGIEFMFWVPNLPAQCFATFFCNNKTSRREALNIKPFCPVPGKGPQRGTLKTQYIKTEKFSWHGPVITPCSAEFQLPPIEEMLVEINKFNNPKESEVEAVAPAADARAR